METLDRTKIPSPLSNKVIDIGINLTHKALRKHWKAVIRRAIDAGVTTIVLTGTSIESSRQNLGLAHEWFESEGTPNLFTTVGVHPHGAKSWIDGGTVTGDNNDGDDRPPSSSLEQMVELLKDPFAVAVGECGLDYNRNFSSRSDQIRAFREQVRLAYELDYPLFVHEREAHGDLLRILDEVRQSFFLRNKNSRNSNKIFAQLPDIVVHCFTGTKEEASVYIQKGYYLGFTGTICKKERGAHLRDLLPSLPLEKIMVETDAPYMGFKKKGGSTPKRRHSEPVDCIGVAKQLSECVDRSFEEVCQRTTQTALNFFRISCISDAPMPFVASRNGDN